MNVSEPPNSYGVLIKTEVDSCKLHFAKFTIYFLLRLLSLFVGHSFRAILFRYVALTFGVN
jgi:hypothetical protein